VEKSSVPASTAVTERLMNGRKLFMNSPLLDD